MGMLTIGVVTRPFAFEGKKRLDQALYTHRKHARERRLPRHHPNERLKFVSEQKITFKNAFAIADDVLRQAVANISELITVPGFINLDFADVTSVMKDAGFAHIGTGAATGKDKATEASADGDLQPRCLRLRSTTHAVSSCPSAVRPTSASRRSRPQQAWYRQLHIRTHTSSSVHPSTRSSTTSCALLLSQPALTPFPSLQRALTAASFRHPRGCDSGTEQRCTAADCIPVSLPCAAADCTAASAAHPVGYRGRRIQGNHRYLQSQ